VQDKVRTPDLGGRASTAEFAAPWLSGLGPSHPCARCGTDTAGIAIGGICANCMRSLTRRATRIARLVAIGTTVPLAVYVALACPVERTARLVGR